MSSRPDSHNERTFDATAEEVEDWARRERERRQAWLSGPTEEEKAAWARQRNRRVSNRRLFSDLEAEDPDLARTARQFARMSRLAQRGMLHSAMNFPFFLLERLVLFGLDSEDDTEELRRRRIRWDDE